MRIAFKDISRSRLRFGLLAGAVGLLFFLLLFLNTLSSALLGGFVGAIENGSSDVLVYSEEALATIPASRLDPSLTDEVADVEGVAAAAPISVLTASSDISGEVIDVAMWGVGLGEPGMPAEIEEGRLPETAGEVVMNSDAVDEGFTLGMAFELSGVELTVVGFAPDTTYSVLPTAYASASTFADVFAAEFPEAGGFVPVNVIGVQVDDGLDAAAVAADIQSSVAGIEAYDRAAAAEATPGVSSISQSFGLIVGITFLIVVVVVGFFFQILTVQKLKSFAVLKAVGVGNGKLAGTITGQIATMVIGGVAIGTLLLAGAAAATRDTFAIDVDPVLVATAAALVLGSSLLAGLFPIRRVVKQDPAEAAMGAGR